MQTTESNSAVFQRLVYLTLITDIRHIVGTVHLNIWPLLVRSPLPVEATSQNHHQCLSLRDFVRAPAFAK